MDDSLRPLTDACMKLTGLGVRVAHTEQDLLQLWRIYVVYWQGVKPKDELLGFLHALAVEVRQIQADITTQQDADSARMSELFKMQENVFEVVILEAQTHVLPCQQSNTFYCQVLGGTFRMMELLQCALKQRREAGTHEQFHAKFELMTQGMMQNMKVFSDERHAFEELQLQREGMLRAEYEKAAQEVRRLSLENSQLQSELEVVRKRKDRLEDFNRQMLSEIAGMAEQNVHAGAL